MRAAWKTPSAEGASSLKHLSSPQLTGGWISGDDGPGERRSVFPKLEADPYETEGVGVWEFIRSGADALSCAGSL